MTSVRRDPAELVAANSECDCRLATGGFPLCRWWSDLWWRRRCWYFGCQSWSKCTPFWIPAKANWPYWADVHHPSNWWVISLWRKFHVRELSLQSILDTYYSSSIRMPKCFRMTLLTLSHQRNSHITRNGGNKNGKRLLKTIPMSNIYR